MNQVFPEITADERQVGGNHYANKVVQPWDAMQAWMTPEQFEGYLRGNALKYLARYPDKNGLEDVKKAAHYVQKLAEVMALKMPRKPEDFGTCGNVGMEDSE